MVPVQARQAGRDRSLNKGAKTVGRYMLCYNVLATDYIPVRFHMMFKKGVITEGLLVEVRRWFTEAEI